MSLKTHQTAFRQTFACPEYMKECDGGDVGDADEESHGLVELNPHEAPAADFEVVELRDERTHQIRERIRGGGGSGSVAQRGRGGGFI